MVKNHISPNTKSTGSTTAALIDITHSVSMMLEENKYVLFIDFAKAFDSVDHVILINKLKALNIDGNIISWVASFLTDRNQYTKLGDQKSFTRIINRSNVQGSGIEPTLFIIFISDLTPSGRSNHLTKYADDASLLVPEKTDVQINDEF